MSRAQRSAVGALGLVDLVGVAEFGEELYAPSDCTSCGGGGIARSGPCGCLLDPADIAALTDPALEQLEVPSCP